MMKYRAYLASALLAASASLAAPPARADKAALEAAKAAKQDARLEAETGSFSAFNPNASGRNKVNAYLLSYLALMVYPQNLGPATGVDQDRLQTSHSLFESTFKQRVAHFFTKTAKFQFFDPTSRELYNPEAVAISTDDAVFVVFRGTDRLENSAPGLLGDLIFDWGEWVITDGNVQLLQKPKEGLPGLLHRGMKQSLDGATEAIIKFVSDNGGKTKPVWITGHSLGGAHAQIMGGYLKKRGANVKGVYVYNSPHPGDPAFAAGLNATLGQSTIQRFEYLDDPIAMLPPQTSVTTVMLGLPLPNGSPVGGFGRAGVRNFYSKLEGANFFGDQAERREGTLNRADLGRSGIFSPLAICFHNPHWIAQAAYKELPEATRAKLPAPPSLSSVEACTPSALDTGRTGITPERELVNDLIEAGGEAIETVSFNAAQIAANLTGTAVDEGDYFIRCNKGKKYLDISGSCTNKNGCEAQLWDLGRSEANNIFRVKKEGPSYRITLKHNGKSLEVEGSERFEQGGRVQIWDSNSVPMLNANQKWFFYRIPGGSRNRYLLVNAASFRVLDAANANVNKNGGGVYLRKAVSNDQTQVWFLEKAN